MLTNGYVNPFLVNFSFNNHTSLSPQPKQNLISSADYVSYKPQGLEEPQIQYNIQPTSSLTNETISEKFWV